MHVKKPKKKYTKGQDCLARDMFFFFFLRFQSTLLYGKLLKSPMVPNKYYVFGKYSFLSSTYSSLGWRESMHIASYVYSY